MVSEDRSLPDNTGQTGQGILELGRCRLVDQITEVSAAVRDTGTRLGQDTAASRITGQLARTLQNAGDYINSAEPRALVQDANNLARRQPEVFLGGAFIAGLLLGRFLRAEPVDQGEGSYTGQTGFDSRPTPLSAQDDFSRTGLPTNDGTPEAGSW